jgi:hypothetical protein
MTSQQGTAASGEQATGTKDTTYALVSVLYHALQGAETSVTYLQDAGSRTRWLRIMFRGFSRSVWEVSIIRSSALEACFQPLVQSS